MVNLKNHYETLGVSTYATSEEILHNRNILLRQWHPDMNPGNPVEAKERTIEILAAADILLDAPSREQYDRAYRSVFCAAKKKQAAPKSHSARSNAAASAAQPAAPIRRQKGSRSVKAPSCRNCGRININPKFQYCIFCGAGLGDNSRPYAE